MRLKNSQAGFSLVEMSVSMAIIGMLVAAIIAGNSIKHRLELNEVMDDISAISTAFSSFQTAYNNTIPGDLFDAEDRFGPANTNIGNGNNVLVATEGTGTAPVVTNRDETLLFWQHLSLAGLIDGTYDGATAGKGGQMETPMKHGVYGALKTSAADLLHISASKAVIVVSTLTTGFGLFTTKEAYDYDNKYDDGNPMTGTIRALDGSGETAEDCVIVATTSYKLTNPTEKPCVLHFYIQSSN